MHPSISKNIKPNVPLTPQVISSINILHQEQEVQVTANTNTGKSSKVLPLPISKGSSETSTKRVNVASHTEKSTNASLTTQGPNSHSVATSNILTVQPPLTLDFNDLNGYFTTSSASVNQIN